jgi:hypothetical protein
MFALAMSALVLGVADAEAHPGSRHRSPSASVTVHNDAGAAVTVTVDGQRRYVRAYETVRFTVDSGDVDLRATYEQFGRTFTADAEREYLRPGRSFYWRIEREREARVLVENTTPIEAEVFADGRRVATLQPRSTRVLSLPEGYTRLQVRDEYRVIEDRSISLRAFGNDRLLVDAPRDGLVELDSELHTSATVYVDGRYVASLLPGERERVVLGLGSREILVRDDRGRVVDTRRIEVQPFGMQHVDLSRERRGAVSDGRQGQERDHDHDSCRQEDGQAQEERRERDGEGRSGDQARRDGEHGDRKDRRASEG